MEEILTTDVTTATTTSTDDIDYGYDETVSEQKYIYDRNDLCIRISPYDSYKRIYLYRYNSTDSTYTSVDVETQSIYKYYLEFVDAKRCIRIPEYTFETDYTLDSNELVFKISQSDAKKILNLASDKFYLVVDVVSSDDNETIMETQQLFFGRWSTEEDWTLNDTAKTVSELKETVEELNTENNNLQIEALKMSNTIIELQNQVATLKQYEQYKELYENLINEDTSTEYTATNIENAVKYVNYNINMTEEEQANAIKAYADELMT